MVTIFSYFSLYLSQLRDVLKPETPGKNPKGFFIVDAFGILAHAKTR